MKIGLASNDRVKNAGQWEDHANFIDVVSFSESCEKLTKGQRVAIDGKLRYSSWEKDGQKRTRLEVVADRVQFLDPKSEKRDDEVPF